MRKEPRPMVQPLQISIAAELQKVIDGKVLPSPDAADILMSLKFPPKEGNGKLEMVKKAASLAVSKKSKAKAARHDASKAAVSKEDRLTPLLDSRTCHRMNGVTKEYIQRGEQRRKAVLGIEEQKQILLSLRREKYRSINAKESRKSERNRSNMDQLQNIKTARGHGNRQGRSQAEFYRTPPTQPFSFYKTENFLFKRNLQPHYNAGRLSRQEYIYSQETRRHEKEALQNSRQQNTIGQSNRSSVPMPATHNQQFLHSLARQMEGKRSQWRYQEESTRQGMKEENVETGGNGNDFHTSRRLLLSSRSPDLCRNNLNYLARPMSPERPRSAPGRDQRRAMDLNAFIEHKQHEQQARRGTIRSRSPPMSFRFKGLTRQRMEFSPLAPLDPIEEKCETAQPVAKRQRVEYRAKDAFAKGGKKGKRECREPKSQMCNQCGKTFSTGGNLSRHMLTHSDERPFACGICFKSFRQRVHLKKHIRLHTGEKPYSCSHCSKSFTQKSTLTGHIRTKHTGETPYHCSDCDRRFPTRNHLRAHKNKCMPGNSNNETAQDKRNTKKGSSDVICANGGTNPDPQSTQASIASGGAKPAVSNPSPLSSAPMVARPVISSTLMGVPQADSAQPLGAGYQMYPAPRLFQARQIQKGIKLPVDGQPKLALATAQAVHLSKHAQALPLQQATLAPASVTAILPTVTPTPSAAQPTSNDRSLPLQPMEKSLPFAKYQKPSQYHKVTDMQREIQL